MPNSNIQDQNPNFTAKNAKFTMPTLNKTFKEVGIVPSYIFLLRRIGTRKPKNKNGLIDSKLMIFLVVLGAMQVCPRRVRIVAFLAVKQDGSLCF